MCPALKNLSVDMENAWKEYMCTLYMELEECTKRIYAYKEKTETLNFINKITTTVCSSLYTWAVNKNCMEGFLTERWW
jgi:hypothetical protein